MREELAQLDADLKGVFAEDNFEELNVLLSQQPDSTVKELSDYYWNIIKQYYETERFDLLFAHFNFVAFTCYIVEYAHQATLISDDAFGIMMMVYNDVYELKRQQKS